MTWFKNRKTVTKLMIGFGFLTTLMVVVGSIGIAGLGRMNQEVQELAEHVTVGLASAKDVSVNLMMIAREIRQPLVERNSARAADAARNVAKYEEEIRSDLEIVRKTVRRDAEKAKLADVDRTLPVYLDIAHRIIKMAADGQIDAAVVELGRARESVNAVVAAVHGLGDAKEEGARQVAADSAAAYTQARWMMIVFMCAGALLAVGTVAFIARLVARPLGVTVSLLKDLAQGEGDLTKRLPVDTIDEVGEVGQWFNQFMEKLHDIIRQARETAEHVAGATQQLSAATEQLSSGAQEQASSLEETAASLEEITGTVKQNADNARQANQLATGSRDTADKGGQVVAEAVEAMNDINRSSKKIAAIITTIDEIAFQTNLLALNAAVEAARAGEQGRGFAVVAAEVRNLAQRSATAAKEIKALIQDSVAKVEGGSELVNRSGATLGEIVGAVKRVTDIIAEIAAASAEQTTGIDQVNKAVSQMDQVTQANAAQTEELSSTSQSLAARAQELNALVGRFKLATGRRAGHLAAGPAALPHARKPVAKGLPGGMKAASHPKVEPVLVGANGHGGNGHAARAKDDGFEEF